MQTYFNNQIYYGAKSVHQAKLLNLLLSSRVLNRLILIIEGASKKNIINIIQKLLSLQINIYYNLGIIIYFKASHSSQIMSQHSKKSYQIHEKVQVKISEWTPAQILQIKNQGEDYIVSVQVGKSCLKHRNVSKAFKKQSQSQLPLSQEQQKIQQQSEKNQPASQNKEQSVKKQKKAGSSANKFKTQSEIKQLLQSDNSSQSNPEVQFTNAVAKKEKIQSDIDYLPAHSNVSQNNMQQKVSQSEQKTNQKYSPKPKSKYRSKTYLTDEDRPSSQQKPSTTLEQRYKNHEKEFFQKEVRDLCQAKGLAVEHSKLIQGDILKQEDKISQMKLLYSLSNQELVKFVQNLK